MFACARADTFLHYGYAKLGFRIITHLVVFRGDSSRIVIKGVQVLLCVTLRGSSDLGKLNIRKHLEVKLRGISGNIESRFKVV